MRCTRCACYNNPEEINYYTGQGSKDAAYMFVGDSISKKECDYGTPLGGDFKKILNNLLSPIELEIEEVYITNACRCYIKKKKISKQILDACFLYLNREINQVDPSLVIALGPIAMLSLTGIPVQEFNFYRGKVIHSEKINRKVFITHHPLDAINSSNKRIEIADDFVKIPLMLGVKPFKVRYYDYTLIDTQEKFDTAFDILYRNNMLFDIESEGLDPYDKELNIRTLQLGLNEDNIFVLTPVIIYDNIDKLKILFNENPVIGQDFSFDAKWLFIKLGIFPKIWYFDTCLAEFLISGMKDNDLNFLTGKYNPEYYGYWEDIQKGGAHLEQDFNKLCKYGASDVGTMHPIHLQQKKILFKNDQYWLFNNITMPCNVVLTKMSLRGVQIDLDTLWEIDNKYKKRSEKLLFQAQTLPGISECENHFQKIFNPNSSDMVRWLLIDYYKLPVLKKTPPSLKYPEGRAKVSQDEISIYAGRKYKNKYCKIMERYGSIQTLRSNFLSGSIPKLKDGVAHTQYSLHATTTGRPNSKNPNLLNYPSSKEYKEVKRCLKARDGFIFLTADMSQIEVRVASVIYDDRNLIDLCNADQDDFHSVITAKVHGLDYDEVYIPYSQGDVEMTDKRRICKSITFGILYQMGEESLAYSMGVSKQKARIFINEYFEMFPSLKRNIEKIKEFVIRYGYVETYFKFRRYFSEHTAEDHGTLREAVNTPIQGTAWNLMQLSLIQIGERLEGMKSVMILQIYDSVCIETAKDEVEEVAFILKDVMETVNHPYKGINRVKIKIDLDIGYNLADMEKYNEKGIV